MSRPTRTIGEAAALSLPPAAPRAALHTRQVECRGFRREDGLWDIEGHLVDTKAYPFANSFRGEIPPGEPLHDMWLRLTLDDSLQVQDVVAVTAAGPFAICPVINAAFAKLKGLRIGKGWRREVLARLGGVQGCTHLVELLWPIATAAYQTIYPILARERTEEPAHPPSHLDTCHALARDGEVVREHYPRWYTGDRSSTG